MAWATILLVPHQWKKLRIIKLFWGLAIVVIFGVVLS
jgi:hypothetical protein